MISLESLPSQKNFVVHAAPSGEENNNRGQGMKWRGKSHAIRDLPLSPTVLRGDQTVECKQYQGLEILPIPIFCRSDIADHRPIEQYLPIGQCICRYAHYLPIVNAFADTYADIYRQIFFSYWQIFLSIGRYRVYLPIQGLSADS